MHYEVSPEPSPEEREALIAAMERMLGESADPPQKESPWWQAGIRENVETDEEAP